MRESQLEVKFKKYCASKGGQCLKLHTVTVAGLPDRLVLLPNGVAVFVELKTTKGVVSKLQAYWHTKLRNLGFRVEIFNNVQDFDKL